jgi:serine/threonine protein phosphatase PrpC
MSNFKFKKIFAKSLKGNRNENQDNYLICRNNGEGLIAEYLQNQKKKYTYRSRFENFIRIAVADGMGGHDNGREAAESVIKKFANSDPVKQTKEMLELVKKIHKNLQKKFPTDSEKSPGSTLVVADINTKTGEAILINVGDSRAYLKRNNRFECLTYDHTFTEFAFRDEEIDQEEYEKALNYKNNLVQAMIYGSAGIIKEKDGYKPYRFSQDLRLDLPEDLPQDRANHADVFSLQLEKGDILVLATDGLFKDDPENEWQQLFNNNPINQEFVEKLVNKSSQRDNVTTIVCEVL